MEILTDNTRLPPLGLERSARVIRRADMMPAMKLPRWIVATMLLVSTIMVVGVGMWAWITWPTRTAETFVRLMNERKWEEASKLTEAQVDHDFVLQFGHYFEREIAGLDKAELGKFKVQPTRRSWSDILSGRQEFEWGGHAAYSVVRGKVRLF